MVASLTLKIYNILFATKIVSKKNSGIAYYCLGRSIIGS